jgi:hypothetical protein
MMACWSARPAASLLVPLPRVAAWHQGKASSMGDIDDVFS